VLFNKCVGVIQITKEKKKERDPSIDHQERMHRYIADITSTNLE